MLQNATPLRKSAPGPPNISDKHASCTAPATENASLHILFKCPTPGNAFGTAAKPSSLCFVHFDFEMCFAPQLRAFFSTSQLAKVVRAWCVLYILTSKCASRHNGVHFFDISTSKSGPTLVCLCILTSKSPSCHNGVQFFDILTSKSGPNHWKNTVFRDFPTFSRICIFFLLTLSLLLFFLLLFSNSSHLCPYCRKFDF